VIWRPLIGFSAILGVAALLFLAIAKSYRIPAASMEPTLHCARPAAGCKGGHQDHVLALRYMWPFRGPRRGDIVALRTPARAAATCGVGGTFIKRVIALPREAFAERKGVVYVNGLPLREPYVKRRGLETLRRRFVPPGSYFVLGDARTESCDSRVWGAVPRKNLIARVVASYWPPSRIGLR
jgi:signal peptidase I